MALQRVGIAHILEGIQRLLGVFRLAFSRMAVPAAQRGAGFPQHVARHRQDARVERSIVQGAKAKQRSQIGYGGAERAIGEELSLQRTLKTGHGHDPGQLREGLHQLIAVDLKLPVVGPLHQERITCSLLGGGLDAAAVHGGLGDAAALREIGPRLRRQACLQAPAQHIPGMGPVLAGDQIEDGRILARRAGRCRVRAGGRARRGARRRWP